MPKNSHSDGKITGPCSYHKRESHSRSAKVTQVIWTLIKILLKH